MSRDSFPFYDLSSGCDDRDLRLMGMSPSPVNLVG
jgi:hypothetical protein